LIDDRYVVYKEVNSLKNSQYQFFDYLRFYFLVFVNIYKNVFEKLFF
jgi:hypothetical protein